jgi:hypothetical protein
MKSLIALLAAATLLGCAGRGSLPREVPSGAAGGDPQGFARAGAAAGGGGPAGPGGAAGVGTPVGLCPSRTGRLPDQLTLLGQDGGDIVFVRDDGVLTRVHGPGTRNILVQRTGWVAAYDAGNATTWKAQLFDVTGRLRAESSGAYPPGPPGKGTGIGAVSLLSDGTATFDFGNTNDDLVLTPDGRARVRPFFSIEPDAAGWVGVDLFIPAATPRLPVMMNVESGEIRKLSLLAATDAWAPIVSGARRLYLAEVNGTTVLVDESPQGARQVPLPGFARRNLEVEVAQLTGSGPAAYVALHDGARLNLPVWLYDLSTGGLVSALPDGKLPDVANGSPFYDGKVEVTAPNAPPATGGTRLWTVELSTGSILDYRAGLTVHQTRPAPGGPSQWIAVTGGGKQIYRYDQASGAVDDLHISGDLTVAGRRALVVRDQRPREVVNIDDGAVTPIAGSDTLPPGVTQAAAGRWAVGYASLQSAPWAPGLPVWRVDLETAETRVFSMPDASLMPLLNASAPLFRGAGTPLLADGRAGVMLYDGFGAGLYLAEPDAPWVAVGRRLRQATWIGWAVGPAFAIAAEKDCNCYGPLTLSWPTPPTGTPEILSGTSLQFVASDGTDVFPPAAGEHLGAFADQTASCALATTDAHEWVVYDTQARTRQSLGRFDSLSWIADAP